MRESILSLALRISDPELPDLQGARQNQGEAEEEEGNLSSAEEIQVRAAYEHPRRQAPGEPRHNDAENRVKPRKK